MRASPGAPLETISSSSACSTENGIFYLYNLGQNSYTGESAKVLLCLSIKHLILIRNRNVRE